MNYNKGTKTVSEPSNAGTYFFFSFLFLIVASLIYSKEISQIWEKRNEYISEISNRYNAYIAEREAERLAEEQKNRRAFVGESGGVYTGGSKNITAEIPIIEPEKPIVIKEEVFDFSKNDPEENTELLKETISKEDFNLKKIKALVEAGADVNAKTYYDTIFVDVLGSNAPMEVVEIFINNGADLKYKNYERHDIFVLAAKRAINPEIISFLVRQGFECETIENSHGANHLLFAAKFNNNVEVVKEFTKICPINSMDEFNENALFYALEKRSDSAPDVFKTLVDAGVSVNVSNINERTLLTKAAEKGFELPIFVALIDAGINVNIVDSIGYNVLSYIYAIDDMAIVKLLIDAKINVNQKANSSNETPLHNALKHNKSEEFITLLLDAGADLSVEGNYKETPLHVAAKDGKSSRNIELLLEKGANPNAKDYYGQTPLMLAIIGYPEVNKVDALLKAKNIKINEKSKRGETALAYAIGRSSSLKDVIKPLVNAGADVNAIDEDGNSILKKAIGRGVPVDVIRYLLENKADPNKDSLIFDVMYYRNNPEFIKAFVRGGANMSLKDKSGYTPLARAIEGKYKADVIGVMIDHGADINAKTPNGISILSLAKSNYPVEDEVISLLINSGAK